MRSWKRLLTALAIVALGLAGHVGHVGTTVHPEPTLVQSTEAFVD